MGDIKYIRSSILILYVLTYNISFFYRNLFIWFLIVIKLQSYTTIWYIFQAWGLNVLFVITSNEAWYVKLSTYMSDKIRNSTWMLAPVTSRISLILEPPLPMSEPHCEAGTMSRSVMGARDPPPPPSLNCEHHCNMHYDIALPTTTFMGRLTLKILNLHENISS